MKHIKLTKNQVATVDNEDCDWIPRFGKWKAQWSKTSKSFYASHSTWNRELHKTGKTVLMHRLIMGLPFGDKRQVDHKNHNTLDNRKCNLFITNHSGNALNSTHAGCYYVKKVNKWYTRLTVNKHVYCLGYHKTKHEAHRVYILAKLLFARSLNA